MENTVKKRRIITNREGGGRGGKGRKIKTKTQKGKEKCKATLWTRMKGEEGYWKQRADEKEENMKGKGEKWDEF